MTRHRSVIAVDVGKRVSGIAVFRDRFLLIAQEVHATPSQMADALLFAALPWADEGLWVAEKMMDYAGKAGRAADLEQLRETERMLADLVRDRGCKFRLEPAHRWKGGTPKEVCHRRVLKHLHASEVAVIREQTKETLDAIGIGLYVTKRLGRGMRRTRRR